MSAALFFSLCVFAVPVAFADEFTSSSFRVLDPVIVPSGYATSSGFQLWSSISQIAIGTSSAGSFTLNPGFLSFPFVSTPAVSATAGDAQVALSWTASDGFLGWTVGGYTVGQSTTSGGPYTYTAVGNVLASTPTGLTNGTTYYFVVVVNDTFGNPIATSTQVSATPAASTPPPPAPSGGGGGGGVGVLASSAFFLGRAYPYSTVTLLKDAQIAAKTVAGGDAKFQISLSGLSSGSYLFALYGEDNKNNRSPSVSFPVTLTSGSSVTISGIFLAPSIATDKSEVKRGDNIAIFGQSSPQSDIVIAINSEEELFAKTKSDTAGVYLLNFDTSPLENGSHSAKSKALTEGEISAFGKSAGFIVGAKNVTTPAIISCSLIKGDVNHDCRVNLVDFSIAAYWYKRPLTAVFIPTEKATLSGDGKVDLKDFSIMAYYWTG